MTEPIFEIVTKKRKTVQKSSSQTESSYKKMVQDYLSQSYGYYTEIFIKKVSERAQNEHQKLRKFQLRRILRQVVRKYMLTDLQIVFLQYFTNQHQWDYQNLLIQQSIVQKKDQNTILYETNCLKLFLYLVCFFVKSYVGLKQQVLTLVEYHNESFHHFGELYQQWMLSSPENCFKISPRQLNQIYTEHSRNTNQKIRKKDYNEMVDKILDLSTTYSIIPVKQKQASKSKKSSSKGGSKQAIPLFEKSNSLKHADSHLWQQNSFKLDFSDLKSHHKDKDNFLHLNSSFISQIPQKIQHSIKEEKSKQSLLPKKISLNKKKKVQKDQINTVAKSFFRGKDVHLSVQDLKKNENNLKDFASNSFLDLNARSSRFQSLPLPYRNNSNIFGPSTLF